MRVRVLGAGIIGLACADELLRRGHDVEVVDPAPGSGASYAAAGMLAPAGELWHGEADLFRLGRASADLWPAYAARLGVPLAASGTVLAAADAGDLQEVDRQLELLAAAGERAQALGRRELAAREPGLGRVVGGAFLPEDHSVDPRSVVRALLARVPVMAVASGAPADATVIATGAHLPSPWADLVRPVRGEVIRLRSTGAGQAPLHTVRGLVHGMPVYVVPRAGSDEIVVGATSEEHDTPPVPTVEGVFRLLESARILLPALDRAEVVEVTARDRPGTRDNLPLVGRVPSSPTSDDTWLAAGHFRHGVLLAPITAQLLADGLEGAAPDPAVDPSRFARQEASA
ncbi:putative thiamine biosynthesis oxidoreductase ThiO [Nocardioides phosphati]|uniref:Thiamine biosynthesis oxidoreductase ThiO n=1 Tax=Nocardioides phosphati TaxID=1867775 RepID=A0ABQ2NBP6_9ACTN|nr:FAD-dependent oxidoreductase [Nocardioides phosphati]GGO89565.1 putative thiamine biosynthesis oxidoreductase ThiO [Nocardioides phosphati]